jgi:hypothetical protein
MGTSDSDFEQGTGRLGRLIESWSTRGRFDDWVVDVSEAYIASRLRLEGAAKLLDTTPAELQAVLNLATLDEEELRLIGENPPPKTTWLTFALASREGIEAAIAALGAMPVGASPFHTVRDAIHGVEGPTVLERVAALTGPDILHMWSKAKQYGLLSPKSQKALESMGKQKRTGRPLTPRQTAYLYDLLRQLADGGAVRRDSPDGDQDVCDAVLDAIASHES